jgi:pimeloyl-ACP methyl ester carboxylesterase
MEGSEIRYARAGEHHIAYREYGGHPTSDVEIVMVNGFFFPMESLPDDPMVHRLLEGLAGLGRLVVFDRRGIGLSDAITDWETALREQWADDLAAVITAAGCDRPAVFSWHTNAVARTCSVRCPDLVGRLVLFNPGGGITEDDMHWAAEVADRMRRIIAGEERPNDMAVPGRAGDQGFDAWVDTAGREPEPCDPAQREGPLGSAVRQHDGDDTDAGDHASRAEFGHPSGLLRADCTRDPRRPAPLLGCR